jgi:glutathione S-transferase
MKLIGMLDSPYVRRVAVSLQFLGLRFEHQALSVFRTFTQFQQVLMPAGRGELAQALRVIGLALVACEKSVQIVYERQLRPPEKLHEPWVARVTGQVLAAYGALEEEIARLPRAVTRADGTQAGICTAVTWLFTQQEIPEIVPAARYPALAAFSAEAEVLPEFRAAPHGDGTYRPVIPTPGAPP